MPESFGRGANHKARGSPKNEGCVLVVRQAGTKTRHARDLFNLSSVRPKAGLHGRRALGMRPEYRQGSAMNAAAQAHAIVQQLCGFPKGNGWMVRCPAHDDENPSLHLSIGDSDKLLVKCHAGCAQDAVLAALTDRGLWGMRVSARNGKPVRKTKLKVVNGAAPESMPILPVPASVKHDPVDLPRNVDGQWVRDPIAKLWPYRDAQTGALLGFDARVNVKTVTWCKTTTGERWKAEQFPKPRPLYYADHEHVPYLAALLRLKPKASVLIAEGCKTADAWQRLVPGATVVSWPGGANAAGFADWTQLVGRRSFFIPDWDRENDPATGKPKAPHLQPGIKAALTFAAIAEANGMTCAIILWPEGPIPPEHIKSGWDGADAEEEGWTQEQAREWIKSYAISPADFRAAVGAPENSEQDSDLAQSESEPALMITAQSMSQAPCHITKPCAGSRTQERTFLM
jgi:hypothetical protein